jgi:hypothetical protein
VYEDIDEVTVLIDVALDVDDHLFEERSVAAWSLAFLDTPRVSGAERVIT